MEVCGLWLNSISPKGALPSQIIWVRKWPFVCEGDVRSVIIIGVAERTEHSPWETVLYGSQVSVPLVNRPPFQTILSMSSAWQTALKKETASSGTQIELVYLPLRKTGVPKPRVPLLSRTPLHVHSLVWAHMHLSLGTWRYKELMQICWSWHTCWATNHSLLQHSWNWQANVLADRYGTISAPSDLGMPFLEMVTITLQHSWSFLGNLPKQCGYLCCWL